MASTEVSEREIIALKQLVPKVAEEIIYIDGKPLRLERPWQWDLVGSCNYHEIWNKSRQIGFSWGDALRSLIRAHIFPPGKYNKIFVSINREEAREKIRYIRQFYESMPTALRKATPEENQLQITFSNGNSIRSFPSKAVRGAHHVDLSIDEAAHVEDVREIYDGSTASGIRGNYGITIGSTPFGYGFFHDVFLGAGLKGEFQHFVARSIPWWKSEVLCKDIKTANIFAPCMTTEERVYRFGTQPLIREYESHILEAFCTEFECSFMDSGNSVLSEELIRRCSDGEHEHPHPDIDCGNPILQPLALVEASIDIVINEIKPEICFVGFDVGREINASEIIVLYLHGGVLRTCLYLTLRRAEFPLQHQVIEMLMKKLPVRKLVVDATGQGVEMAEEMERKYGQTIMFPMKFSINSKEEMVASLQRAMEEDKLRFYSTRRMLVQLLSVKKVASDAGRLLYKASQVKEDKQFKSHADLFWALAMAVWGASEYLKNKITITNKSPILRLPGGMRSTWSGYTKFSGKQNW